MHHMHATEQFHKYILIEQCVAASQQHCIDYDGCLNSSQLSQALGLVYVCKRTQQKACVFEASQRASKPLAMLCQSSQAVRRNYAAAKPTTAHVLRQSAEYLKALELTLHLRK